MHEDTDDEEKGELKQRAQDFLSNISLDRTHDRHFLKTTSNSFSLHHSLDARKEGREKKKWKNSRDGTSATPPHSSSGASNSSSSAISIPKSNATAAATDFLKGLSTSPTIPIEPSLPPTVSENKPKVKKLRVKAVQKKSGIATVKSIVKSRDTKNKIFYIHGRKYPFLVSSFLPYNDHLPQQRRGSTAAPLSEEHGPPSLSTTPAGVSYCDLLKSFVIGEEGDKNGPDDKQEKPYDPLYLDSPELTTGKHRTVLNLHCFRETIIPYVNKKDLKAELNEQFKMRHPWMQPGITLHKIRKLKKFLWKIAVKHDIEPSTVALAYVYLEKLLLKNLISKETLKLYGGICLFLAQKFNGAKNYDYKSLLQEIEEGSGISKKEILSKEFAVYAQLSFGLFVDPKEILPHLQRLILQHNITVDFE